MNLPKLTNLNVSGKRVLVRADVDLGEEIREGDEVKLSTIVPTLKYLIQKGSKVIIIGHRGRPEGKRVEELSLKEVVVMLSGLLGKEVKFVDEIVGEESNRAIEQLSNGSVVMLENLRFDKRESFDPAQDAGAEEFAKELASLGEIYINEAFAVSHRAHVSIVGIPKFLPHAVGIRFIQEIEHLNKVIENPERPLIFLISGIKKDKLEMIENIKRIADKVLVAGRLPEYMEKVDKVGQVEQVEKTIVAQLNPDKEDITLNSIEKFEEEINKAKTIVLAGVIGKYEDEGHRQGTKKVFEAVANSSAYKVAGGGDTEQAIKMFNLQDKFDWISVGGGAMLDFLAKRTLPGIEALM